MNIDDLIIALQELREKIGPNGTTNVTGVWIEKRGDWDITIGVTRDSI